MAGEDMLDDIRLHAHLLGKPGSRRELNTPVLVVDRDAHGFRNDELQQLLDVLLCSSLCIQGNNMCQQLPTATFFQPIELRQTDPLGQPGEKFRRRL